MHRILYALTLSLLALTPLPCPVQAAEAELPLLGESKLVLVSVAKGQGLLGTADQYTRELTRFDLESRLQTREGATVERLLKHAAKQVRPWTDAEVRQISDALASFRGAMSEFRTDLFPAEVHLIKTTGLDEGRAAYCRGNSIILPQNMIDRPPGGNLAKLLAHELFHILSRQNKELRGEMYRLIGFELVNHIALPESLAERKITNPDAPLVNSYITLDHDDEQFHGAPLLYANAQRYDPSRGGTFFDYMKFELLQVEPQGDRWQPKLLDGQPVLINPARNASYFEQIGKNTGYIIHPEEIMAENFAHLVTGTKELPNPEIVQRLGGVLKKLK